MMHCDSYFLNLALLSQLLADILFVNFIFIIDSLFNTFI